MKFRIWCAKYRRRQDAAPDPNASREDRIAKLKCELRDHIRSFGDYKLLSVEWLKMAESLQQVLRHGIGLLH
jgi:hypothetical protein